MIKMSYNRCKDIHKFGNKYLPLAYKTQVDFRSNFSGKEVYLIVQEIRYLSHTLSVMYIFLQCQCTYLKCYFYEVVSCDTHKVKYI